MELEAIGSTPWAATLAGIARRHKAAELVIEVPGGKQYRIAFEDGAIVGATSPLPNDSAVRIASVNHFISRAMAPELAKRIVPGVDELDTIVELAQLTEEQSGNLWRLIVAQRAARTFVVEDASWGISPELTIRKVTGVAVDVGQVIYQGARLNLSEERLAAHLRKAGTYFVMRPDADLSRFNFDDEVQPVIDALTHGASLPELEAKHRDVDPRTLRALVATLVACEQCEAFFEQAIQAPVLPPEQPVAVFKKVEGGSYADRSAGKDVVADPITYRVKPPSVPPLTRRPTEPPPPPRTATVDVNDAEAHFQNGLRLLRGDQAADAVVELEVAVKKNPQIIDYLTYLAWARFCAADDKQAILKKTREACMYGIQHSPQPVLGWFFLGRAERICGHDRDALRHFQQVLSIDPKHADAAAEVRVLEARLK